MKSDPKIEVAVQIPTILGEGPLWSCRESVLYWLDIFRPSINRFDPATKINVVISLKEPIYALGLYAKGGFIAALNSGFVLLSSDGKIRQHLSNPIAGKDVNFNDGKVDDRGRFWSGTMARDWKSPIGALYKVAEDGLSHEMDRGMILSNGIAWSPNREKMYFADFGRRCIYAYDFDIQLGTIESRRQLIAFDEQSGCPDGMTVDVEGCIWVAHWDGWCISRHDADGREIRRIRLPVQRPTSVMFGGKALDTLYVTSATMHLTAAELSRAPLSGAIFSLSPGVQGLPEAEFRLFADEGE
jgi:sugar lactone lactonase YvrE